MNRTGEEQLETAACKHSFYFLGLMSSLISSTPTFWLLTNAHSVLSPTTNHAFPFNIHSLDRPLNHCPLGLVHLTDRHLGSYYTGQKRDYPHWESGEGDHQSSKWLVSFRTCESTFNSIQLYVCTCSLTARLHHSIRLFLAASRVTRSETLSSAGRRRLTRLCPITHPSQLCVSSELL